MTFLAADGGRRTEAPRRPRRAGKVEIVATIASLCAIALFVVIDIVRTAPPDAPVVEVTFDVAPPGDWLASSPSAEARWAADESAQGSRPDSAH